MSLTDAAEAHDRRAVLAALQVVLAESIEEAPAVARAPLAKQLADVTRELDGLAKPKGSKVDDLAARRARRRTPASEGAASPAVGD